MLTKIYLAPDAIEADYAFDPSLIDFNNTNPKLKIQRPPNLLFFSHFSGNSVDAEYSRDGGVLTGTAFGSAGVNNDYLILGAGNYVSYQGLNNVNQMTQKGTIEFRVRPTYSGNPLTQQVFFSLSNSPSDVANLIEMRHEVTGIISFYIFSQTATAILAVDIGTWTPVAGQTYQMSVNFDIDLGEIRLFIDGTQLGSTQSGTGVRSSAVGNFYLGRSWNNSGLLDAALHDFEIYDEVLHTSDYTPIPFGNYSLVSPSFQTIQKIKASKIIDLIFNNDEPVGSSIVFVILVGDIPFWFNGSTWVESTNVSESNSSITSDQLALLDLQGLSEVSLILYFNSDGEVTPTCFSFTIDYLGYGFTHIVGYFLNSDGSPAINAIVEARPTELATPLRTNAQVDGLKLKSPVGALGKWELILITNITYDFVFSAAPEIGARLIEQGTIRKLIDKTGTVQFNEFVNGSV